MARIAQLGMRRTLVAVLVLVLTLGAGSTLVAQGESQGHTYYGCLASSNGQIYSLQIDDPNLACRSGDRPISWNQVGPAGLNGIDGVDGQDGADGNDGVDGQPGLTWRGGWTGGVSYAVGDAVAYLGGSFIAVASNTDEEPGEGTSWSPLALAGSDGPEGPQGPPGDGADVSALETRLMLLESQVTLLQGHIQSLTDLPALSIDNVTMPEGNSGLTPFVFTVTLSAPSSLTVAVNYATASGTATAGSDFEAASGTLTFEPGVTSQTITVNVIGDTLAEMHETFFVNLSNGVSAVIVNGQGLGTILNDDTPQVRIENTSCRYGSPCAFTVRLSGPTHEAVRVEYRTVDGTALADTHYSSRAGTLLFSPGQQTQIISVSTKSSPPFMNWATRFFFVDLSNPVNATLSPATRGTATVSE